MRIALNCLALDSKRPIGVERFFYSVMSGVRLGNAEVTCHSRKSVNGLNEILAQEFIDSHQSLSQKLHPVSTTLFRILYEMLILPLFTRKDDVVLSINNFGPLWGKRQQSKIIVIHDVWFMSEGYEGGSIEKLVFRLLLKIQIRFSTKIVTVSEFSKREIVRYFAVSEAAISVVSNCLGSERTEALPTEDRVQFQDFLLLVGSDRKNKNVKRGIEGFCLYRDANPQSTVRLVVVGKYAEPFFQAVRARHSKHIEYLDLAGYVDDKQLEQYFNTCKAVVFPSLYEGFGIPAIEAISRGKPVLLGANTACAEVAGDFAVAVDATCVNRIADGISDLMKFSINLKSEDFAQFSGNYLQCEKQSRLLSDICLNN